jgi:iron(III) transport system substrate-binding protein
MRRRSVIKAGLLLPFGARVVSAAPAAEAVTPALVEAARKEGKIVWYSSVDLALAEKVGKGFEARYPGVTVKVERSGAERNFQRIGQEYASKIYNCDVVNSSDASHFIIWKREKMLAAYVPEDVARDYPDTHKDADGMFASWRITLSPIAYNTKLVKAEEAPKSFADLLDPKWSGKIVKAHPGYSGVVMTSTQQLSRELGWSWFEKLSKQKVMQVQSATEPPKKMLAGERAIMADGGEYLLVLMKEKGDPIEIVYPTEGTPLITGPSGIMANAPNPNAARLFHAWSMTAEAQQLNIDIAGLRSAHPKTKDHAGARKFSDIKLFREEAAVVADKADEIKAQYTKYFKV